jgi:hypothetical protein
VPAGPTVLNLTAGISDAIDQHLYQSRRRTDIGEIALLAATESLSACLTGETADLFGPTRPDVRLGLYGFSTRAGFASFAHDFFARFTRRYLSYHLSRELASHVGEGKRFASPAEHTEFLFELGIHCREAARILRDFAGDWHSKANFEGGITRTKAGHFIRHALRKLRAELAIRGGRGDR